MNKKTDKVAAILRIMGNTYPEIAALMNMTVDEARAAVWRGVYKADIENPEQIKPREGIQVARELAYEEKPEYWLTVLTNWQAQFVRRNELVRSAKKAGVTIADIARALDVTRDTIYRWLEEVQESERLPLEAPKLTFQTQEPYVSIGCAVLHQDSEGNTIQCPGYPLCLQVHSPPAQATDEVFKVYLANLNWKQKFFLSEAVLRHNQKGCSWGFVVGDESLASVVQEALNHYGECDKSWEPSKTPSKPQS